MAGALAGLQGSHSSWLRWMGLFAAGMAIVDYVWGRWNPLVTVTPEGLIVRALLRAPRELPGHRIASWSATRKVLRIQMIDGSACGIPLLELSTARQNDLFGHLARLAPRDAAGDTRQRRNEGWMWVFWIVAMLTTAAFMLLRRLQA